MTLLSLFKKIKLVIFNFRHLLDTRVRYCGCCRRLSVIVSFSKGEEYKLCVLCRANLRYELIAQIVRKKFPDLTFLNVLELDKNSPLQTLFLGKCKSYLRTFYSKAIVKGTVICEGVQCEDITRLTLPSESLDLIVSSDVLEHVPALAHAFKETARVLRKGGCHIFTVPVRDITRRRAEIGESGEVIHLDEPEYHSDPLDPKGILAFWDLGLDLFDHFNRTDLKISMANEPVGVDRRVVWVATKV